MRVLIIDSSGLVLNVVTADSVEHAAKMFPTHECIEQPAKSNIGPGWVKRDSSWNVQDENPVSDTDSDEYATIPSVWERFRDWAAGFKPAAPWDRPKG